MTGDRPAAAPITGSTRVYAVLGRPVRHSRSPVLHNAWFARYGLDSVYVALEVPEQAEGRVVSSLEALGIAGANVTVPLKIAVLSQVHALEPVATAAGAVNTLFRDGDRWVGTNTDVEGYCLALEAQGVSLSGRDARIVGTGGAARAVAVGLASRRAARIVVLGRDEGKARALVDSLRPSFPGIALGVGPIESASLSGADLCTIATSGRPEAVCRLDPGALRPGAIWVDLNYWDPDPPGWQRALQAGHQVIDGQPMLHWQARLAFRCWTGILPETLS